MCCCRGWGRRKSHSSSLIIYSSNKACSTQGNHNSSEWIKHKSFVWPCCWCRFGAAHHPASWKDDGFFFTAVAHLDDQMLDGGCLVLDRLGLAATRGTRGERPGQVGPQSLLQYPTQSGRRTQKRQGSCQSWGTWAAQNQLGFAAKPRLAIPLSVLFDKDSQSYTTFRSKW